MYKKDRPLNKFIHCKCGATYISGYLQCPKCGESNPTLEVEEPIIPEK